MPLLLCLLVDVDDPLAVVVLLDVIVDVKLAEDVGVFVFIVVHVTVELDVEDPLSVEVELELCVTAYECEVLAESVPDDVEVELLLIEIELVCLLDDVEVDEVRTLTDEDTLINSDLEAVDVSIPVRLVVREPDIVGLDVLVLEEV